MWGRKKAVEEPVDVDEVFDDLYAELDDIVETADEPEAEVPVDFEARVAELTVLLREAQERAAQARLAVKPEGLSPFKTPFESKPAAVAERSRSLNRRITRVEVEASESRIVSQFEDNEPEEKKVYPAVWNLGYRLEELAAAVANLLMDPETGEIYHKHDDYAPKVHSHDEYFHKGGASDDDGNPLPLPYPDGYTLGTALDEHEHEFPDPVYMGDDEPEKPSEGDLWYDTNRLEMFIRYQDGWITTTALGARVAEGEAKQREIEQELSYTRTRLAGVQGESLAYGMWRLSLGNQNPRAGDFVFLTNMMQVTHELGETKYMQISETDKNGKTVSFTGITGGDVVRITEPGDKAVTLFIKRQMSKGLFEVFVQEGAGRPRSDEVHFIDFIRNDLRTSALRNDPIFRFMDKNHRTPTDGDVYYDKPSGKYYVSFKTLYNRVWGTGGWDAGWKSDPPTYPNGITSTSGKNVGCDETVTIEDVASGVQLAYFNTTSVSFNQFLDPDGVTIRPYSTTHKHSISINKNGSMRMTLPQEESLVRIRMGSWL